MKHKFVPIISATGLMAFIVSCAAGTFSNYEDKTIPADQIAIIRPHYSIRYIWQPKNGKEKLIYNFEKNATNQIRLKPGDYRIEGEIRTPNLGEAYLNGSVNLKSGHIYKIESKINNHRWAIWMEDETTGEVVAGALPDYEKEKAQRSKMAAAARETQEHFSSLTDIARCGDAAAQYRLGLYYLASIDPVENQDLIGAYIWYRLAAMKNYQDADEIKDRIINELQPEEATEAELKFSKFDLKDCKR